MKKLAQIAAALLVAGVCYTVAPHASAERPPRDARNCETNESRDVYPTVWHYLVSGENGANYYLTTTRTDCQVEGQTRYFNRYGMIGQLNPPVQVIEDGYDVIAPYSTTSALVKREDGRWMIYRLGQGEVGRALPYEQGLSLRPNENCEKGLTDTQVRSPDIAVALSAPGADGKRTAYVYFGDDEPSTIPGLGGAGVDVPIERHRDVLIGRWSDPDGSIHHRLFSLAGRPLSPVLGDLVRWATITDPEARDRGLVCNGTAAVDILTVGPALDVNPSDVFVGHLLTPLGADGAPVTLPDGAIGVFPVPPWPYSAAPTPEPGGLFAPHRQTRVWAVAYPTAQSFEFTLHEGTLAEAIAASPGSRRYQALGRSGWSVAENGSSIFYGEPLLLGLSPDGAWHGVGYFRSDIRGAPNTDFAAAVANTRNAFNQTVAAERAAWEAEQARIAAENLRLFDARFSDGTACRYGPPWQFDEARVARHALACASVYNLDDRARLRDPRYPPEASAHVEAHHAAAYAREQAYLTEQAELARNYVPPGAWEAALRAASDQQVRDINQSTENWLAQRRAQHNADWQRSQRAY